MPRSITCALISLALCTVATAQFQSQLTTTYAQNNGCYGNLFDVGATNDLTICSFDIHLEAGGNEVINVWAVTGGGSWNQPGVMGTPSAWTMIGQATVVGQGIGVPTSLNLNLGYPIPAGTIQGFAIEKMNTTSPIIRYTNGTAYGSVEAMNADMTIYGGGGLCSTTPGGFTPNTTRNWNGTIFYELGLNPTCILGTPPSEYQVNQPGASMTMNGQVDPGQFGPIVQASQVGTTESIDLGSVNVGVPYDIGITIPGLTQGLTALGIVLGGQTVNIDLNDPTLLFLNGGAMVNLQTTATPAATFSIGFVSGAPVTAAGQMVALDPANAAGFSLSHACEYYAEDCNPAQNFDNLALGAGNSPIGWTNPSTGVSPWTVNSAGTPSVGTGPTAAQSGSQYMYCETSVTAGTMYAMDTCSIDLTQISGVTGTLNFQLSRIGATVGTLTLLVDDGTGFVPITDPTTGMPVMYVGPDASQSQGGTEWSAESVPFLHDVTNSNVSFRFAYVSGTSFTGDVAIDSFQVN